MIRGCMRALALAVTLSIVAAPAAAQEKTATRPGFSLLPGTAKIMLMRPSIHVGAQSTGGMYEPNADWTAQARDNIGQALRECQAKLGNQILTYDEGTTGDGPLTAQYANLFGSVADSVIDYQFFKGNRLPTKKRKDAFEWGMGPGLAKLQSLSGAQYGLFINTYDAYGSTGRKVLQIVAALGGIPVISGEHTGYAGLVDLKTGELVWLNADRQMGGDVRNAEGAHKRIRELLKGFPGRPSGTAPGAVCADE